jgi:uncharacterized protein YndB with AHSA1/START domain
MGIRESATAHVAAPPDDVFAVLTAVARLPEWNRGITEVVEAPDAMAPGAVWKVRIRALGQSWVSRSRVEALDAAARRFAYRSQSDDGNPSYADWEWLVVPEHDGARVTVAVDLNPRTFWRRHLLVKIRRRGLRREMVDSLAALGEASAR